MFECKSIILNPFNFNAIHSQPPERFERVRNWKVDTSLCAAKLDFETILRREILQTIFFYWVEITAPRILN